MFNIGIIGATGYTGSELVRILFNHPDVSIKIITSESHKGKKFSEIHPQFKGIVDHDLKSAKEINPAKLDIIFLALPHGISMRFIRDLIKEDIKIIDLSGDFRLSNKAVYEEWYKTEHTFPEGFEQAVFGISELYEDKIKDAKLVANPGCFPTGAILALAPLVSKNLIDKKKIIIDSKTGVTGAGINPKSVTHFPNVNENFMPYGIKTHRHTIEIQEQLSKIGNDGVTIQFTPHLLPVDRGILTSSYTTPLKGIREEELKTIFKDFYTDSAFIRIIEDVPELKNVRATNFVDIYPAYDIRTNNILVFSAIDNLVKGAAGQAVQNMNIMLNLKQESGLYQVPIRP
jgi:N-acetyl-gamma-glutamyl-phosphate reductase